MERSRVFKSSLVFAALLLAALGTTAEAAPVDPCDLLAGESISKVQGEPPTATKRSRRVSGLLVVAQCYFTLPSRSRSVSLELVRPDDDRAPGDAARARWKEIFAAERLAAADEAERPRPLEGLGEQAFWSGNDLVGAIYVLHGESYVRISIGGAMDVEERLRRSRELARAALVNLPAPASARAALTDGR